MELIAVIAIVVEQKDISVFEDVGERVSDTCCAEEPKLSGQV